MVPLFPQLLSNGAETMHSSASHSNGQGRTPAERTAARVMVHLDATIDDGKVARMYKTQNLSVSGMLVRTRAPLPVGTRVDIQFLFPGDPALSTSELPGGYGFVEGAAEVVRHTHPEKETFTGMGLNFVELEERGRSLLGKFLSAVHRGPSSGPLGASV
jgi:c-di-GMP-binding flagellar brake protein YcgR